MQHAYQFEYFSSLNCQRFLTNQSINIISLLQYFEAGFLQESQPQTLNSGIILKTFTHANMKCNIRVFMK